MELNHHITIPFHQLCLKQEQSQHFYFVSTTSNILILVVFKHFGGGKKTGFDVQNLTLN